MSGPPINSHGREVCPDDATPLAYPNPAHPNEEWNGNGLVCPNCGRRWLSDGTEVSRRIDVDEEEPIPDPDAHPTLTLMWP